MKLLYPQRNEPGKASVDPVGASGFSLDHADAGIRKNFLGKGGESHGECNFTAVFTAVRSDSFSIRALRKFCGSLNVSVFYDLTPNQSDQLIIKLKV